MTPFDNFVLQSYSIGLSLPVKCTFFEIWRHIGRKSSNKTYPTLIWHVPWGLPFANFSTSHILPSQTRIVELSEGLHFKILLLLR